MPPGAVVGAARSQLVALPGVPFAGYALVAWTEAQSATVSACPATTPR